MPSKPLLTDDASPYAWARLVVSLTLMTISGCSMYAVVVVLPAVQAEFGVARADASLPYSLTMIGFGVGGLFMGRLADRFGVMVPLLIGALSIGLGFAAAGMAGNIWTFSLAHGVLIGVFGSSAMFAPLIADTSLWFTRRRGIAVAICASGNYLAGAVWPPVVHHFVAISEHVARRIRRCYGREADVIHPPVDVARFDVADENPGEFYLVVSALAPYKRIDLAITAAGRLGRRLLVVGTGPEERRLRGLAGPGVEFLGWRSDAEVASLYSGMDLRKDF